MLILTSKDNTHIKAAVKIRKNARYRRDTGLFIAEGMRICMDAVYSRAEIKTLFLTEDAMQKFPSEFNILSQAAKNTFVVSSSVFSYISDTQTPQGFMCVIKALDKSCQFDTIKCNDKFLALDNVQDPSNLGTILRTAEAFNISGVILSRDCCDIYSPKVVRGSMGAVFRLPFLICDSVCDFLENNSELTSYAAVVSGEAQKITNIKFKSPCVVAIGNEGNGLKPNTVNACSHKITIPMDGRAESLNASTAASIIMWEMIK